MNRLECAAALKHTPKSIYEQIKQVAQARFNHELPEMKKLVCLASTSNKLSLLRNLCKAIGIQINAQDKAYQLNNNIKQVLAHHNALIEEANSKTKKSKASLLSEQDLYTDYKYLPFQANDITSMYPVVKGILMQNTDVKQVIAQANIAFKEQMLEKAFELYSQAVNILLQIYGPMDKEVAQCIC